MSRQRLHSLFVVLATTLVVGGIAACRPADPSAAGAKPGSASASTSSGQPADATGEYACHLLTLDEVDAVLQTRVAATEQDKGVARTCRFRPADPTGGSVYVTVLNATAADFQTATANLAVAHTAIGGVGDKAVFAAAAGELVALTGTYMVAVIIVHKGPVFGTEAEARSLATAAIARL